MNVNINLALHYKAVCKHLKSNFQRVGLSAVYQWELLNNKSNIRGVIPLNTAIPSNLATVTIPGFNCNEAALTSPL